MNDIYTDDLEPTEFEKAEARHAAVRANNAERERRQRRAANRKAGHPVPRAGVTMHVSLERGLARRSRAGLRFEKGSRVAVEVLDVSDDEIVARQKFGKMVVNLDGAEKLLEDTGLNVYAAPAVEDDLAKVSADRDRKAEELTAALAEIKRLRNARSAAPESPTGAPTRLQAGRAAAKDSEEFGGKPPSENK